MRRERAQHAREIIDRQVANAAPLAPNCSRLSGMAEERVAVRVRITVWAMFGQGQLAAQRYGRCGK
jgi:hypothetical protein